MTILEAILQINQQECIRKTRDKIKKKLSEDSTISTHSFSIKGFSSLNQNHGSFLTNLLIKTFHSSRNKIEFLI